jgi:hypothetical protein
MVARPYRDWYTDNARDPFIGNYAAMYANYDLAHTPHKLFGPRSTPMGTVGFRSATYSPSAQPTTLPMGRGPFKVTTG